MNRRVMVAMALAVVFVIPIAGCSSGKAKLSAAKICASAGGKYSMQAQTCDAPAQSSRRASDMCMAHGGTYDANAQVCEVGLE